jgi:hypothetical protein
MVVFPVAIEQYPEIFKESTWILPLSVILVGICWLAPLLLHERVKRAWLWGSRKFGQTITFLSTLLLCAAFLLGLFTLDRFHVQHLEGRLRRTASIAVVSPAKQPNITQYPEPKLPNKKIVIPADKHQTAALLLTMRFYKNGNEPRFSIANENDNVGIRPKWGIFLCDYTNQYYPHYKEDPDSSEPLPIPVREVDDFVKGDSILGNFEIFNEAVRNHIKPGDRVFGILGITCMNCSGDSKFWFYWEVGYGGWYAPYSPVKEGTVLYKGPSLTNRQIDDLIDSIVPAKSRVAISEGKGSEMDLTQP